MKDEGKRCRNCGNYLKLMNAFGKCLLGVEKRDECLEGDYGPVRKYWHPDGSIFIEGERDELQ